MQFAINYSPQAQNSVTAGKVHFDRYKLPDWEHLIAEAQAYNDVYVHFPLYTGRGMLADVDFDRIEQLRASTNTPYVNTHIATDYNLVGTAYADESPATIEKLFSATMRDIEPLIERWGADNIIIENAPTHPADPWHIPQATIRPEFIRRVIETSGAGFLLDTAHAWIASETLGMNWRDYLDALPVEHLRELHVTGIMLMPQDNATILPIYYDHFAMRPEDWLSVEYTIEHIKSGAWAQPWIVSFEYGGVGKLFEFRSEQAVIERDATRIASLCRDDAPQPL